MFPKNMLAEEQHPLTPTTNACGWNKCTKMLRLGLYILWLKLFYKLFKL